MQDYLTGTPEEHLEFKPKSYVCPRAPGGFVCDGRLDKPFWAGAPWSDEFIDIEWDKNPAPYHSTRMKMLWDDEYLYVGALLQENMIWGHQTQRDCVVFQDNDFEIFIDPDGDTHNYYELEINVRNTLWDLFLQRPYRDGAAALNSWDIRGIQTAVYIDGVLNDPSAMPRNKAWSVEFALPWKVLKERAPARRGPVAGEYWRIDFSRVEWKTDVVEGQYQKRLDPATGKPFREDNWIWSPIGLINMHYPELWGFVYFADSAAASFTIPQDEYLKWEMRKLYYRQRAYFNKHGRYCADYAELCGGKPQIISPVIETTSSLWEAWIPSSGGKGRVVIRYDGRCTLEE